jgi:predicted nucleic acid-binding protein
VVRVSLDANVLVYALHLDDRRNARAVEIVTRAARGDCTQTMQSFAECFNVLIRKREFDVWRARDEIMKFRRSFDYVAARPVDFDDAMRVVGEHKMSFWDAMLWATARRAGCEVILSENMQDGRELEGVRVVNPFDQENDAIVEEVFTSSEATDTTR